MNASSQTLQDQGSPILLLAYLHQENSYLPAAEFHVSPVYPTRLEISLHDRLADFEVWLTALGLSAPAPLHYAGTSWLTAEGVVDDVPVTLNGYGTADAIEEYAVRLAPLPVVTLPEAVALMGALPMPTAGELAEQRHLVDPLDHVLEHLADEQPPAVAP